MTKKKVGKVGTPIFHLEKENRCNAMKYSDWCVNYYKKDAMNCEGEIYLEKQDIQRIISEKLIRRLNYLTGKFYNYDDRTLDDYCYSMIVDDNELKKHFADKKKEKEAEKTKLEKQREDRIKDIQKLIKKKGIMPDDELQRKINQKKNKIEEIDKKYNELDEPDIDLEGVIAVKRRFDDISEIEELFFEYLLTVISAEQCRKIKNDEWECLAKEHRENIIRMLHEVKDSVDWQLTEEEIKYIEFKLRYPVAYRLIQVQDVLEEDEEVANDSVIIENMQHVCEGIDNLYKNACIDKSSEMIDEDKEFDMETLKEECPVIYDAVVQQIK